MVVEIIVLSNVAWLSPMKTRCKTESKAQQYRNDIGSKTSDKDRTATMKRSTLRWSVFTASSFFGFGSPAALQFEGKHCSCQRTSQEYDGNLDNKESVCCEGFCFIMKFVTCSLHTGSYKTERKGFEG